MKIFILTSIIYITLILIMFFIFKSKIKSLSIRAFSTKENKILMDILNTNFNKNQNEILMLQASSQSILDVLIKNYKLDYCTILIHVEEKESFISINSNVETKYIKDIENYCNKEIPNIDGKATIDYSLNSYLKYPSAEKRLVKYSYLIPLKLKQQEKLLGALYVENKVQYKNNFFELEFFELIVKAITLALQNSLYHDQISNMAVKDNLTKIYNRNYFEMHLDQQIKLNKPFSIAMFDIDFFKKFNDQYGHEFGDLVLFKVAEFIQNNIREYDAVYRWGGEEFFIFFYNTNSEEIFERLDEIRENLSKLVLERNGIKANVTASFGLANFPEHATDIEKLRECADKALYKSKENGRNKLTIYETGMY